MALKQQFHIWPSVTGSVGIDVWSALLKNSV